MHVCYSLNFVCAKKRTERQSLSSFRLLFPLSCKSVCSKGKAKFFLENTKAGKMCFSNFFFSDCAVFFGRKLHFVKFFFLENGEKYFFSIFCSIFCSTCFAGMSKRQKVEITQVPVACFFLKICVSYTFLGIESESSRRSEIISPSLSCSFVQLWRDSFFF